MKVKTFHFVMIKPAHYDDDGYVIQWFRSSVPSNTLAVLYGLALDCAERNVLGEDTQIELYAYDETNTRIKVKRIIQRIQESGDKGLVALVGVQSNQFPRAMDIARQFIGENIQVCIGGFHVSGCLAMLPEIQPDLQEAMDLGISLFAGELEGRLESLFRDASLGEMKPLYNFMQDLPSLEGVPVPYLPASLLKKTTGQRTSFDAGRGCPFQCSFCTIINVQGRTSRSRVADDVEHFIRIHADQGIKSFFISDDNFARNKAWESILDRLIQLREKDGFKMRIIIQVDTVCHKIPRFIEKAGRAGVTRVFIGMESINPEALKGAQKRQNQFTEYRRMLQAWHQVGVLTYAGYILGFPTDTPETILEDIKTIQRELPIDLLEYFILTPLPGSQDHKTLYERGVKMEKDMNRYDVVHVTTAHPKMSEKEWLEVYHKAWDAYYSLEHVETIIRRAKEWGFNTEEMMLKLLTFYGCMKFENIHPLEGGFLRLKYRKDRRPNMPLENPFIFYPRYLWDSLQKYTRFLGLYLRYKRILHRVEEGPSKLKETDVAMIPDSPKPSQSLQYSQSL